MGQYSKIWANEDIHDHKWVNIAKIRFIQDYLIDTCGGIW